MTDPFYEMIRGVSEAASQPLCKLIDTIRAGAGLVYEPIHIKRIAKAEAEALVIRENTHFAISELRQRAAARLTNTETRRQRNIESVIEKAAEALPDECSEEPVDPDWMADFIDCCKDVGNEEIQSLWGKLLSGEVTEPGAFSRRALNALKLMSQSEAALFMLIGFRVWKLDRWPVLLIPGNPHQNWPDMCPFTWGNILTLANINLVDDQIHDEHELLRNSRTLSFDYYGRKYEGFPNPIGAGKMPYWVNFTRLGAELLPLVEQEAGINDAYLDACDQCFDKPSWRMDETSEFRELIVPDDLVEALNLNRPKSETGECDVGE